MTKPLPFSKETHFEYGVASEVAPGVRRLVAPNAGSLTYRGTNTYIVGRGQVAVIDPGPDDPRHLEALLASLDACGERVTHIFVTHTHLDHCAGLPALRRATGALTLGFGSVGLRKTAKLGPGGKSFADAGFAPDVPLRDGDRVCGMGWEIEALHTPGHAPDHLCLSLADARVLFSGDHVMGWNTTVVAPPEGRMSEYVQSLERLLQFDHEVYLPGHGGRINEPHRLVKAFIVHRRWRESEIVDCLRQGMDDIPRITAVSYKGLPEELTKAAQLAVLAHLEHLIEQGLVEADGYPALDATYKLRQEAFPRGGR